MRTVDDVLELLDASVASAAAGAALELGLLGLLDRQPLDAAGVGERLGIPGARARVWLHVLERAGLVEAVDGTFAPTPTARAAILGSYSPETWALLAVEARERRDALADLPRRLSRSGRTDAPDYVAAMAADPERARRFTRMLFELHQPVSQAIAASLDLDGVRRVLDIGGGSGVVSLALARRWPLLSCTVVDIATVCDAGRRIAEEQGLADRVSYLPADLTSDSLPSGVDLVVECDVGIYDRSLFGRVLAALRPGGRFAIVARLPASPDEPSPNLGWALADVLADPEHVEPTVPGIEAILRDAGFADVSHRSLRPPETGAGQLEDEPFGGQTIIEATAPGS